jgi:GT2 family glycosyltransferase
MISNIKNNPLVSIIVITYNSSQYVLETLESTKNQTYENIELIITDDASTDKTVQICLDWLKKNGARFARTNLITSPKNTGIPANCNRGLKDAQGDWIKYIAGDDLFIESCIDELISFADTHPNALIISANMYIYNNHIRPDSFSGIKDFSNIQFNKEGTTATAQYYILLRGYSINSPTLIFNKSVFENVGVFDEDMPYEDWPYMLKCTKTGYKIYFLKKCIVNYRKYNKSMSNSLKENEAVNDSFWKERIIYNKYIKDNINNVEHLVNTIKYCFINFIFRHPMLNNKNIGKALYQVSRIIYNFYKKRKIKSCTNL